MVGDGSRSITGDKRVIFFEKQKCFLGNGRFADMVQSIIESIVPDPLVNPAMYGMTINNVEKETVYLRAIGIIEHPQGCQVCEGCLYLLVPFCHQALTGSGHVAISFSSAWDSLKLAGHTCPPARPIG